MCRASVVPLAPAEQNEHERQPHLAQWSAAYFTVHQCTQSTFNAWPLEAKAESVKQSEASMPSTVGGGEAAARAGVPAAAAQVTPPQSSHEACDDVQNEPAPAIWEHSVSHGSRDKQHDQRCGMNY